MKNVIMFLILLIVVFVAGAVLFERIGGVTPDFYVAPARQQQPLIIRGDDTHSSFQSRELVPAATPFYGNPPDNYSVQQQRPKTREELIKSAATLEASGNRASRESGK